MLDLTRPWPELPFVVVDTETTGIGKHDEPVEVSAVRFEGGQVADAFAALVRPSKPIPAAASAIHGITDEMVADALPLEAYLPQLLRVCRDAVPVAYNAAFDRRMLQREALRSDAAPAFSWTAWVCPLVIVRDVERVTEGKGWYKLDRTCARWDVPLLDAHRAESDAIAAGNLLLRLYERGKIKPCSARRLLEHVARRAEAHAAYRTW